MMDERFWTGYFLVCLICYLIGSFPTAYLVGKKKGVNITKEGTGNVGARNTYDVTGSKVAGIVVLVIDVLKGTVPISILSYVFRFNIAEIIFPSFFLILGHNFSIFLKFKGGRGLATSMGIAIIINFWLFIIWSLFFLIFYWIKQNEHIGNVGATILLPLGVIFLQPIIEPFTYRYAGNNSFEFLVSLSLIMSLLILIKHIDPIFKLIIEHKKFYE
ncbi:MAG: glycerol-3-phosphate acyltransferase [Ignavibacteria bacterium]